MLLGILVSVFVLIVIFNIIAAVVDMKIHLNIRENIEYLADEFSDKCELQPQTIVMSKKQMEEIAGIVANIMKEEKK